MMQLIACTARMRGVLAIASIAPTRGVELCFDCVMCTRCYNLQSSLHCEGCRDSAFLLDCIACEHCLGCINLRHARFHIFNQQFSEQEYYRQAAQYRLDSWSGREQFRLLALRFYQQFPRPHADQRQVENVSGNHLVSCRNVHDSFLVKECEDLRYCCNLEQGAKDCRDFSFIGLHSELIYYSVHCGLNCRNLCFCYWCVGGSEDLLYCYHCCENCIGCAGLKKRRYCILNRQFSESEYLELAPRVIAHMRATGEWGSSSQRKSRPFLTISHTLSAISRSNVTKLCGVGSSGRSGLNRQRQMLS